MSTQTWVLTSFNIQKVAHPSGTHVQLAGKNLWILAGSIAVHAMGH